VADFYDRFADRQTLIGVNRRHRAILAWLKRFGLRPDSRVLEIGCGVGTLTQLLAEALPEGSVLGADLSPKSVAAAEERLARFGNVELIVGEATEVDIAGRFDVVVLPDVIEHIPIESHGALFGRVASWVKPEGFVLAHYPNPHHLEWFHQHHPERLQVIDQPIHADALLRNVYQHGLYLDYYERYSVWVREGDYVVAVFRPAAGVGEFTVLPPPRPSLKARAGNLRRRLRGIAFGRR